MSKNKIDPVVQKWALEDAGWHIPGHDGEHTVAEAGEMLGEKFREATLYKDRWYRVGTTESVGGTNGSKESSGKSH